MDKPSETEALKHDMVELRETLDKLAKDVSAVSRSMADDVRSSATHRAHQINEGAQHLANDALEAGRRSGEAVTESVRQHPMQSLLIAFGSGLVLAQLLRVGGGRHRDGA